LYDALVGNATTFVTAVFDLLRMACCYLHVFKLQFFYFSIIISLNDAGVVAS